MKKELKIAGYLFSAIFFAIFAFLFIDAFHQYPNLEEAYILKTEGRNVQATIDDFYTGVSSNAAYTTYYLHYMYEENEMTWTGIIEYNHRDDTTDRNALISYYKSMIGNKVEITIDPNSTNCMLSEDVDPLYNKIYRNEILRFSFGGVGLVGSIAFFVWFLIRLKKGKKADSCKFIKDKEDL